MQTAANITKKKYSRTFQHSYEAEQYLYEVGYVGFYARAVGYTRISRVDNPQESGSIPKGQLLLLLHGKIGRQAGRGQED